MKVVFAAVIAFAVLLLAAPARAQQTPRPLGQVAPMSAQAQWELDRAQAARNVGATGRPGKGMEFNSYVQRDELFTAVNRAVDSRVGTTTPTNPQPFQPDLGWLWWLLPILILAALGAWLLSRHQTGQRNGVGNRIGQLENWRAVVDPQLREHEARFVDLRDGYADQQRQLGLLGSDVATLNGRVDGHDANWLKQGQFNRNQARINTAQARVNAALIGQAQQVNAELDQNRDAWSRQGQFNRHQARINTAQGRVNAAQIENARRRNAQLAALGGGQRQLPPPSNQER